MHRTGWRGWTCLFVCALAAPRPAHAVVSSNAGSTIFNGVNINKFVGAESFYFAPNSSGGYLGLRAVVANVEAGHVCVHRLKSVAVIDDDLTSISVAEGSGLHNTVSGSADRSAVRSRDIDALMELAFAVPQDGVFPLAKA